MDTELRWTAKRGATDAPGQFLGYAVQEIRFLDHLINARGNAGVCLEVCGDTAILQDDGSALSEESKSRTTSTANPVADRAVDFWKTLHNWTQAALAGAIVPDTTMFRLFTTRQFQPGPIAQRWNVAQDVSQAAEALTFARAELLGPGKPPLSATLAPYVHAVLSADADVVCGIIVNLQLEFGSGRSFHDLKASVVDKWVSADIVDEVLLYMLGWVKQRIVALIEDGRPAIIHHSEFLAEVITTVRQFDRRDILLSRAKEPCEQEKTQEFTRTYVRQLDLIGLEYDEKLRAITDFLKAEVDRHDWAIKGRVHATSFDAYEKDLISAWRNYKLRAERLHAEGRRVSRRATIR